MLCGWLLLNWFEILLPILNLMSWLLSFKLILYHFFNCALIIPCHHRLSPLYFQCADSSLSSTNPAAPFLFKFLLTSPIWGVGETWQTPVHWQPVPLASPMQPHTRMNGTPTSAAAGPRELHRHSSSRVTSSKSTSLCECLCHLTTLVIGDSNIRNVRTSSVQSHYLWHPMSPSTSLIVSPCLPLFLWSQDPLAAL